MINIFFWLALTFFCSLHTCCFEYVVCDISHIPASVCHFMHLCPLQYHKQLHDLASCAHAGTHAAPRSANCICWLQRSTEGRTSWTQESLLCAACRQCSSACSGTTLCWENFPPVCNTHGGFLCAATAVSVFFRLSFEILNSLLSFDLMRCAVAPCLFCSFSQLAHVVKPRFLRGGEQSSEVDFCAHLLLNTCTYYLVMRSQKCTWWKLKFLLNFSCLCDEQKNAKCPCSLTLLPKGKVTMGSWSIFWKVCPGCWWCPSLPLRRALVNVSYRPFLWYL